MTRCMLAGRRKLNGPIIAQKEGVADLFFKSLNGSGQCRRAEIAGLAGSPEMEQLGNSEEGLQLTNIHTTPFWSR